MKALVKHSPKEGIWMEDVIIPECGVNDVKIKITHTAICGTDMHIYNWDEWAQKNLNLPLTIGHEFCGVVDEIGSAVTQYRIGDRVSGEGHLTCKNCRNCRAGKQHLCHKTIGVGIHRNGAFAEYLVIPESNVWPIHNDIPSEIASFFDPFGNAVHTALSYRLTGEDVLISGAGPIGIMAGAICKFSGSRNVVITDVNDYRLDLAVKLGATKAINPKNKFRILGIRPGENTAKYIEFVLTRITTIGTIYLAFVALLPEFLLSRTSIPFYLGGTALLIVVVVMIDFITQVQSHLFQHQYENLLKKTKLKGRR